MIIGFGIFQPSMMRPFLERFTQQASDGGKSHRQGAT